MSPWSYYCVFTWILIGVLCKRCWCKDFFVNSQASSVVNSGVSTWSMGSVVNVSPSNFVSTMILCRGRLGNLRPVKELQPIIRQCLPVALIFTPVANLLLYGWIVSTTSQFTCNIKGTSNILSRATLPLDNSPQTTRPSFFYPLLNQTSR